jgi:hypothetical protein
MRDQEILGLMEAYSSIYTQQEELTEEVQIAAQYFYEMGLNEEGIDILIEELGVEEFAEFVYDIAEEYVLTEARSGGSKIEPVTASGKPFKSGKPTGKSLQRLRDKKAARTAGEEEASAAKPSGMKASLQRQSAVAAAAKKQPKKPGLLDRVAGAVNRGIERHNAAMGELKKMSAATAVTAGKVKKAAGEFKKGLTSEEVEQLEEGRWNNPRWNEYERQNKAADAEDRKRGLPQSYTDRRNQRRLALGPYRPGAPHSERKEAGRQNLKDQDKVPKKDGKDMFEHILEHLVAEGYADTNQAALAIMANMSEEWKESILDESRGAELRAKHGDNPSKKLETKAFGKAMSYDNRDRLPTGTGTEVRARYLGLSGRARSRARGETPASSAVSPDNESRTVRSRGGRARGIGAGENRDRPTG